MIYQKMVKNRWKTQQQQIISTSDSSIPEYSVAQDSVGEPPVSTMVDEFTFEYNEIILVFCADGHVDDGVATEMTLL